MIHIITSFFISRFDSILNVDRNNELRLCLQHNIDNPLVEKIHLFVDDEEALEYLQQLQSSKIHIISVGRKPLYSDLFGYAINELKDKICMITNSDIYLHECDTSVINKLYEPNMVFSLTRYEYDMSSPLIDDYCGSHDCFIFKSPIDSSILDKVKHVQHHWTAENVVLYELKQINMNIYNPCYQIKTVHLHKSELREENRPWVCTPNLPNQPYHRCSPNKFIL